MILARISRAIRQQNWFAVVLEFVIVVVGVLMAFQISQWAERRSEERQARAALEQLHAGMEENLRRLGRYNLFLGRTRDDIRSLRETLGDLPPDFDTSALDRQAAMAFFGPDVRLDLQALDHFESVPGRRLLDRPDLDDALYRWRFIFLDLQATEAQLEAGVRAVAEPGRFDGLSRESISVTTQALWGREVLAVRFPNQWEIVAQDPDFASHLAWVELMLNNLAVSSDELERRTQSVIELSEPTP